MATEKASEVFIKMPSPHYMEIATVLIRWYISFLNFIFNHSYLSYFFYSAAEDIPRVDEVKTLIKDIWDLRIAKLRSSMNEFIKNEHLHAKVIIFNVYFRIYKKFFNF